MKKTGMKLISLMMLGMMAFSILAGCGKDGGDTASEGNTTIDVSATGKQIITSEKADYEDVVEKASTDVTFYYPEAADLFDEVFLAVNGSGGYADELVIFKAKDKDAASKLKAACEARQKTLNDTFVDYQPREIPKIEQSVIVTKGNYVMFTACGDPSEAKSLFEKSFS